jgi:hypothetical protein
MGEQFPAITVWQPWATLIAEGLKPYEFRSWPAPRSFWGRRVAIHAGARPVKLAEIQDLMRRIEYDGAHGQALEPAAFDLLARARFDPQILPRSAVVCTAILGKPLSPQDVARTLSNDSDRDAHFNWAWPLTDIERLEPPPPAVGRQGWWTWTRSDG